jgi:deoxyadenosine/deoxycytidine kinase
MSQNQKISIEGNIGSGKSTGMEYLREMFKFNDNVVFVDEPVKEWTGICDGSGKNALELFYEDKENNSFWFQILAYITRLRNLLNVLKESNDKIIISERSIYTDHYVFANMLYESNYLSEMEWKTYKYWFDTFSEQTSLDTIIYIRTDPEECVKRINERSRAEEQDKIPLEYLQACHEKHEQWITKSDVNTVLIDGNMDKETVQQEIMRAVSLLSVGLNPEASPQ